MHSTRPSILLICLWLLCTCRAVDATVQPHAADDKAPDYSKESFVIERLADRAVFENDGTYFTEETARIKIQSQAALQAFGTLHVSYASATSTADIAYVRVIKPDGRVVETPAENILDMPTEITREAPFYSDLKEKQVAVKGLEIGDVLEYQYRVSVKTPLDPGQFWFAFDFFTGGICLDEKLEISVPRGRSVKVENAKVQPTTVEQGLPIACTRGRPTIWKAQTQKRKPSRPKGMNSSALPCNSPAFKTGTKSASGSRASLVRARFRRSR